jgi:hypothetical protein
MKKTLCSLLAVSVMSAAVPMHASEGEVSKSAAAVESKTNGDSLRQAILRSGSDLGSSIRSARETAPAASAQRVPISLPRQGSDRIRKQGKTGMIIGLVSTVVGAAAAVYMVKEMKKSSDDNN